MKIINFILCDDIRSEVGNKKSLMGVYAKELSFSVNADEAGVWPKDFFLGMMLDFSISAVIKKKAQKYKVTYSVNGVDKALGEGVFNFPPDGHDQNADFQMTIFAKSQYRFESCGKLTHCVRIIDASGNEIAQATPMTELLIKENVISS
ncbi:MAG: hypothetical protein PF495_16715 [Spirochaetales bacterium]|jgi:hypothetical protein|nr:hypothetical protein [Spirochaetales bacterium]